MKYVYKSNPLLLILTEDLCSHVDTVIYKNNNGEILIPSNIDKLMIVIFTIIPTAGPPITFPNRYYAIRSIIFPRCSRSKFYCDMLEQSKESCLRMVNKQYNILSKYDIRREIDETQ